MQPEPNTLQLLTPEQLMNLHIPTDVMSRRTDITMWQELVEATFVAFSKKKDARIKLLTRLAEHASGIDPDWSKWAAYYAHHDVEIRMPKSTRIELITRTGFYDDNKITIVMELREPFGIGKRTLTSYSAPESERMPFPARPNPSAIAGIVQSFANRAVKEAFSPLPKIQDPNDYIKVDEDPSAHILDR